MTEKRYFKKMWEEEYYIFDSNTISESDFEEKLEYQDYKAFEDSMMGDEVVNRLNELVEENKELKQEIKGFEGCSHNWGILYDEAKNKVEELNKENQELKYHLNRTEKELKEYKEFMSLG